jgi:hypothetical protein
MLIQGALDRSGSIPVISFSSLCVTFKTRRPMSYRSIHPMRLGECNVMRRQTTASDGSCRSLKQYGELPESAKINENEAEEGDDAAVEFAEGSDDEDDDDDLDDL